MKPLDVKIKETRAKIQQLQGTLKRLEQQKEEQENLRILQMVKSVDVSPEELGEFIRKFKAAHVPISEGDQHHEDRAD